MVSKCLFPILVLTTIFSDKVSLQKICSKQNKLNGCNECIDLCKRIPGELKCKVIDQDLSCECFHKINSRYPFCPESITEQCGKACGEEQFECRIAKGKPACYCTGLEKAIFPYCPRSEYGKCRLTCNQQSKEGECINIRNETSKCVCTGTVDTDGPNRRIMRFD